MTTILKALCGSRAHGLHREDSDYDWRGVYVEPTSAILSLGYSSKGIQWIEGKEDHTNYEIGHFLMLATKANPSVMELLRSPHTERLIVNGRAWGMELCALMPYMYDPKDAFNAFCGYSLNQRKKLLEDKDGRKWKYATAYIRTLHNLIDLLETGDFSMKITNNDRLTTLKNIRDGRETPGAIVDIAAYQTERAQRALETAVNRKDMLKVNEFLLDIRQSFWGENR